MPDEPVVLRTVPPPRREGIVAWVMVALLGPVVIGVAWFGDPAERVSFLVRVVVQASLSAVLVAGLTQLRFSRVTLEKDGLRLSRRWGKDRMLRSQDIDYLSIDPRGGPRIPRLNMRDQRQLALPVLREEDLPILQEWVRTGVKLADSHRPSDEEHPDGATSG